MWITRRQLILVYRDYKNLQFTWTKYCTRRNVTTENYPLEWNDAKPFKYIPGPKPLPLIGNIWRYLPIIGEYYGKNYLELHRELQKKFGDLVILNGLPGRRPIVLVYNVNDIETMYRNEGTRPYRPGFDSIKYYRREVRKDIFKSPGVFVADGDEWYELRSKINPVFMKPQTIKRYTNTIAQVTDEFLQRIDYLIAIDKNSELPSNFINELFKWSLESIFAIVLNLRLGCLDPNIKTDSGAQNMINAAVDLFEHLYQLDVLPSLWRYYSTPQFKKFVAVNNFITDFVKTQIDIAEAQIKNKPTTTNDDEEPSILEKMLKIDKENTCVTILDAVTAAVETTSKTVAAILYFLAVNEEAQNTLHDEIKTFWPDTSKPLTSQQIDQMLFLRACIKEATRIAPVVFGISRELHSNIVMSGYQIPKNTHLLAVNIVLSRSEEHFPQADTFLPERWLRNNPSDISAKKINNFVVLPFGHGPRACIGKRLAMREIEVLLVKLFRNYKFKWNYGEMKFTSRLLYEVNDSLKFQVTHRQ